MPPFSTKTAGEAHSLDDSRMTQFLSISLTSVFITLRFGKGSVYGRCLIGLPLVSILIAIPLASPIAES